MVPLPQVIMGALKKNSFCFWPPNATHAELYQFHMTPKEDVFKFFKFWLARMHKQD